MSYRVFEELCEKRGVTAYKVGKATGISTAALSNWKAGRSELKQDKLKKIADYFGVSVDYLMTGEIKGGYYLNDETAKVAQEILESKELAMLFDVSRKMKPEELRAVYQLLLAMKRKEEGTE